MTSNKSQHASPRGAVKPDRKEKAESMKLADNPDNMLWNAHKFLLTLPIRLRVGVMKDCGMSTPTYYRHMHWSVVVINNVKTKVPETLTHAEKHMIKQNIDRIFKEVAEFHDKFMKSI